MGVQTFTEFKGIFDTDHGKEVTFNIAATYFDNDKEFYTDSNGLQFQKRVLDQRPDWDLKIEGTEHIAANYYPINSAITMHSKKFWGDWLTLLNDRSQGGSALKSNRMEVMIDRRLMKDDYKGLEEALNETDSHGSPLPVTTHSIILLEKDPVAFTDRFGFSRIKIAQKRLASNVEASMVTVNRQDQFENMKLNRVGSSTPTFFQQVYPVAFDEVILRIENAEDWLTSPNIESITFNITDIASQIYEQANGGGKPSKISIQEVTLSASETIEERETHKLKWKTEDGEFVPKTSRESNKLYRQEMRTYRVKFGDNQSSSQETMQEVM